MPEYKQFRKKPSVIEAVQWFRNGDHPMDQSTVIDRPGDSTTLTEGKVVREFRSLHIPGDQFCQDCGSLMRKHGVIDSLDGQSEELVHPGDYILTHAKGYFYRRPAVEFEAMYEEFDPSSPSPKVDWEDLRKRMEALEEMVTSGDIRTTSMRSFVELDEPQPTIPDPGVPQ